MVLMNCLFFQEKMYESENVKPLLHKFGQDTRD